jgi:hypothetical protein
MSGSTSRKIPLRCLDYWILYIVNSNVCSQRRILFFRSNVEGGRGGRTKCVDLSPGARLGPSHAQTHGTIAINFA